MDIELMAFIVVCFSMPWRSIRNGTARKGTDTSSLRKAAKIGFSRHDAKEGQSTRSKTRLGQSLFCLALLVLVFVFPAGAQDRARPHVVLIYADEFRFDCLGATGNPDVKTPNIDALARDGVVYNNSFCTWPVCTPSRLSLLTGQYVQQHRGNSNRSTLPPHTPTFASILRDGGYRTKAVGKMHLTPAYQDVGFQEMLLAEQDGVGRNVDDYHRYLKSRGLINALDLIDQERRFRPLAPAPTA